MWFLSWVRSFAGQISPHTLSTDRLLVPRDIHTQLEHCAAMNTNPRGFTRKTASTASANPSGIFISMCSPYSTSIAQPFKPAVTHHLEILAVPAHMSAKSQFRSTTTSSGKRDRTSAGKKARMLAGIFHAQGRKSSDNLVVRSVSHSANATVSTLQTASLDKVRKHRLVWVSEKPKNQNIRCCTEQANVHRSLDEV